MLNHDFLHIYILIGIHHLWSLESWYSIIPGVKVTRCAHIFSIYAHCVASRINGVGFDRVIDSSDMKANGWLTRNVWVTEKKFEYSENNQAIMWLLLAIKLHNLWLVLLSSTNILHFCNWVANSNIIKCYFMSIQHIFLFPSVHIQYFNLICKSFWRHITFPMVYKKGIYH